MSTQTATSVRITRIINAPQADVFKAWTQPELLRKWSCPEGVTLDACEVDLRVGGSYLLKMNTPEKVYTAFGTYREISPNDRLVYTWDWKEEEHAVGETVVTVEFNDLGDTTEVVLSHDGFPAEEAAKGHNEGWTSCVDKLEKLFA